MNIDRDTIKQFREDFEKAMIKLEKKYDVTIKLGSIRYDNESFKSKIEANVNKSDAEKAEDEKRMFESLCDKFGFLPSDYLNSFSHSGMNIELYGFDTRKKKYPCMLREIGGTKLMKANTSFVKNMIR